MKSKMAPFLLWSLCIPINAQQYTPALPGYQYEFPRDHFNHPGYQTEWWYYTGNLRTQDGHRFGFELTFFRQATSRTQGSSPWNVQDIYMAHLALSDISGHQYYAAERINRSGPGIAGVDALRQVVWNGNWHTTIAPHMHTLQGIADDFSFLLQAVPEKQPIIQGLNGASQKAAGAGHASHYISLTRMGTLGEITLKGTRYNVEGDTWMDHEFFSDSMTDEVGWDWLSIELEDKSELMLYRLRHQDGSVDPYSSGTYVDPHGRSQHLGLQDFRLTSSGTTWTSQRTGGTYPIAWSIEIPALHLQLDISTPLKNQEFVSQFGPSYWEGAIDVVGEHDGGSVHGSGYLEMTGYVTRKSSLFVSSPR